MFSNPSKCFNRRYRGSIFASFCHCYFGATCSKFILNADFKKQMLKYFDIDPSWLKNPEFLIFYENVTLRQHHGGNECGNDFSKTMCWKVQCLSFIGLQTLILEINLFINSRLSCETHSSILWSAIRISKFERNLWWAWNAFSLSLSTF